jgi:hypothetical protein
MLAQDYGCNDLGYGSSWVHSRPYSVKNSNFWIKLVLHWEVATYDSVFSLYEWEAVSARAS